MFVVMSSLSARVEGDDSQALLITLNARSISPLPTSGGPDEQSFLQIIRLSRFECFQTLSENFNHFKLQNF